MVLSCLACNKEQRWQNRDNRARLELSGIWRIEYLKSAANHDRPAMDTTFAGPTAYYTLKIPATNDQTQPTKCYGNLFSHFEFELQAITEKGELTNFSVNNLCDCHFTKDQLYIVSNWDVDEYIPAEFLSLSTHWWVNGVRYENRIHLRFVLYK